MPIFLLLDSFDRTADRGSVDAKILCNFFHRVTIPSIPPLTPIPRSSTIPVEQKVFEECEKGGFQFLGTSLN
jgi:hypothetical protein